MREALGCNASRDSQARVEYSREGPGTAVKRMAALAIVLTFLVFIV
jgi:hypothetical protein